MHIKIAIFLVVVGLSACGGTDTEPATTPVGSNQASEAALENGIGPISTVELAALDPALAQQGADIFNTKCATCHKFDQRYVGPSLEGLLERRTPAFVMNMMLNPVEMVEKHPEVKKMLAEYFTPMPNQNLTEADARAVLEYIRQAEAESEG